MSNKESFAFQTAFFGRYFDCFAFDLKGFGDNQGMDFPYSLDDYCNEVSNYMADNGIVAPYVVAHSFGGRIALKMLSQNNAVFGKVVLTGAAGMKPRFSLKKFFVRRVFKVAKRFVDKNRLGRFYSSDYLSLSPVMRQSFIKIVNEHLDGLLPSIFNPVLILNGKNDKETPLYSAKRLQKGLKNSKLILIEGCGHFAFCENPTVFNALSREFLLN